MLPQHTQELFGEMEPPTTPDGPPAASGAPTLSDFTRGQELGRGGNAAVFLATWGDHATPVALKVIHGELIADPKYIARFRREVSATSRLHHPHICGVHAYGEEHGPGTSQTLWLAMELIDGGSVRELIDRAGRLPPQVAAILVDQLLDALGTAHAAGILHRDIKPANAMVTKDGKLKLVDFGIAKSQEDATVTETGFLVGTPAYMSPEQAVGRPIDQRCDLYAVGVSLYEMLIGKNPYAEDAPSQALLRIASQPFPEVFEADASVPGAIEAVLEGLTARHVDDRYASAEEARRDLRRYLDYVHEVHPGLMREFVADPIGVSAKLRKEQAELEVARGERLLLAGDANIPAAGLALYRASLLSDDGAIHERFQVLCGRGALRFRARDAATDANDDDDIREAKAVAASSPNPAGALKRVADLYRARGDIHRFVVFIRRYLRLRPTDSHALKQLEVCVAGVPIPELRGDGALKTRDILAGVKTGGWAAAPDAKKEAALLLQQPAATVRTGQQAPARPASAGATQQVSRATPTGADARARISTAAQQMGRARGTRPEDTEPTFWETVLSFWNGPGKRLLVASVFLGAFVMVVKVASSTVTRSVDATQMAISDNQLAQGAIERNDLLRRATNMLKDTREHFNSGEFQKVVTDVNRLEASNAPADLVLEGILWRARARAKLGQREAARTDYERFVKNTPLSDASRTQAMEELSALSTRGGGP